MNKQKGRQHSRHSGKYKDQFFKTERNKARRAVQRKRKAESAATLRRLEVRRARNVTKGIPRASAKPKFTKSRE